MGMFDTIRADGREGQVKCWDSQLASYTNGQNVPFIQAGDTYSIQMEEHDGGGFVNVVAGVLEDWADEPRCRMIINKWGDRLTMTNPASSDNERHPEIGQLSVGGFLLEHPECPRCGLALHKDDPTVGYAPDSEEPANLKLKHATSALTDQDGCIVALGRAVRELQRPPRRYA